jgi:Transcriptional regulator PadR-like family
MGGILWRVTGQRCQILPRRAAAEHDSEMNNRLLGLVLCVLADGALHGYAINPAIEEPTGERLSAGSLYGELLAMARWQPSA